MRFYIILLLFCFNFIPAEPATTIVIFGATGDLSAKKLFPAVYNLANDKEIKNFKIIGVGRRPLVQAEFQITVLEALQKHSREKIDLTAFVQENISYLQAPFEDVEGYQNLKESLGNDNVLYYLATEPSYFTTIIKNLKNANLLEQNADSWKRVIIEKPFGYDYASAEQLCNDIGQYLNNEQMYLIDHYLGKEGVLNLIPLRFTNPEMDQLWNNQYIDNVQINLAEKIGIGTRGTFWEGTGLLRDVVQNHVIQMLALLAMEKPLDDCGSIHDEKVKVLDAIRELKFEDVVRGQYVPGIVDGEVVLGYLQENGVAKDSLVETFVAARLFIDNDRWAGVPFYIRAGKRLSKQATEIVITFKDKGRLYIRIQPDSTVSFNGTEPFGIELQQFEHCPKEAYECLILGAIKGDHTFFVDIREIFASWRLFTPILQEWQSSPSALDRYEAGSFGPSSAEQFIEQDGRSWQTF